MSNVFSRCVARLKDAEKALFGIVKDLSLMSLKSGLFMITHQDWLFLINVWFESSILDTDLYVMYLYCIWKQRAFSFMWKKNDNINNFAYTVLQGYVFISLRILLKSNHNPKWNNEIFVSMKITKFIYLTKLFCYLILYLGLVFVSENVVTKKIVLILHLSF